MGRVIMTDALQPHKPVRSPIPWFGGKCRQAKRIITHFPRHHTYVEPYGGAASVLLRKPPSPVEVYNDLDSGLVTFFRVLRDETMRTELIQRLDLTPYSREELYTCRDATGGSQVERAWRFVVIAGQSFSAESVGRGASWGYDRKGSHRGMAGNCSKWLSAIDRIPETATRLRMVQIEHRPALDVIGRFDTADTLFYLDPPYVSATRRNGEYAHEMTEADHAELVDALLGIDGMAVLSGYRTPVYEPLEAAGWERVEHRVHCHAAGRTRGTGMLGAGSASHHTRTECLWINPLAQDRREGAALGQQSLFPAEARA